MPYRTEAEIQEAYKENSALDLANRHLKKSLFISPGSDHRWVVAAIDTLTRQKCILSLTKSACSLMDAATIYLEKKTKDVI